MDDYALRTTHYATRDTQSGASLVEVLVAVAIIAMALTAFITALSTGAFAVRSSTRLTTANNLASSQLESIKAAPYTTTLPYPTIPAPSGSGYVVTNTVVTHTDAITTGGLQVVTVTVSYQGETLVEISNYKVDR